MLTTSLPNGTRLTIDAEYTVSRGPVGRLLDPILRSMPWRAVARSEGALTALLASEDRESGARRRKLAPART